MIKWIINRLIRDNDPETIDNKNFAFNELSVRLIVDS